MLATEPPTEWTPEHVARRMVEGCRTLLATGSRVGPRGHANGWPAMLQEFADLVDEDATKHAREAFARTWRRPSAEEIARSDEALSWPLRYGADELLLCDAVLVWSFCKAADRSIAAFLRTRVADAKRRAEVITRAGEPVT